MFHVIHDVNAPGTHVALTPQALDALPHAEQVRILRGDIAEMWRAHNHNAQVIARLTRDIQQLERENGQLRAAAGVRSRKIQN